MAFFRKLLRREKGLTLAKPSTEPALKAYCPYSLCMEQLLPVPLRSKKCPHCSNEIAVRIHYYTKEKTFLTTEQAGAFDVDRTNYKHFRHFEESLKQFLDVDDTWLHLIYNEHVAILRKRYTKEPTLENVVESISNYLVTMYPSVVAIVHFHHAIFLYESGKKYHHVRAEGFAQELQEYKKSGHQTVQINTHAEKSCAHCSKLDKKIFSIDQAITQQLLPCKRCTFAFSEKDPVGWCRCWYSVAS